MKILKIKKSSPQMGDTLKHDAPVLRVMQIGLWVFVLISSVTVFFGVHSYVSDYLSSQHWLTSKIGYVVAYLALSLVPDLLCSIFFAHVVRSLLKQKYKDKLSVILIAANLVLLGFLVRYSWNMSRSAATSAAQDMTPDVVLADVTNLDSLASGERKVIRDDYEADVIEINGRYDKALAAAIAPLEVKALPYRNRINSLESSRSPNNTSWIDKKIQAVNEKLLPIEEEISQVTDRNDSRRRGELLQLKKKYQDDILFLNDRLHQNRESTRSRNNKVEQKVDDIAESFSREFRKIAGWAIFIVLILTMLLEILYHRNGIEREPVIEQFDLKLSGLFEVIYLPFAVTGRRILNGVRRQYAKMPDLEPEPYFKRKFKDDLNGLKSDFKGVKTGLNGLKTPVKSSLNGLNDYEGFFNDDLNHGEEDCEEKKGGFKGHLNGHAIHLNGSNGKHKMNGHHDPTAAVGGSNKSFSEENPEVTLISDESNFSEDLPICALPGCEKRFVKTVYNKKYCCDDHKKDHYEKRTGKKLHPRIRKKKDS